MISINECKKYAPIILRIGLALVFLWFGLTQLVNPQSFMGYLPDFLLDHSADMNHEHPFQSAHNLPLTAHVIIMGNGFFETVFGIMLILGLFTRVSSLLLALHLFGIMITLGYNDIAIRDLGLMFAAFAIFLNGPDRWTLDNKLKNKKLEHSY